MIIGLLATFGVLLTSPQAAAQQDSAETNAVTVAIPEGKTLTYILNGEEVSVAGKANLTVPTGATDINVPTGSDISWKEEGRTFRINMDDDATISAFPNPMTLAAFKELLNAKGYKYVAFEPEDSKFGKKASDPSDGVISSGANTDTNSGLIPPT